MDCDFLNMAKKQTERERKNFGQKFSKVMLLQKKKKKVIKRCPLNVWEFITMLLLKVVYNLFWIDLPNLLFFFFCHCQMWKAVGSWNII